MILSCHSHRGLKTPVPSLRKQWPMSRYFAVKRTDTRLSCLEFVNYIIADVIFFL